MALLTVCIPTLCTFKNRSAKICNWDGLSLSWSSPFPSSFLFCPPGSSVIGSRSRSKKKKKKSRLPIEKWPSDEHDVRVYSHWVGCWQQSLGMTVVWRRVTTSSTIGTLRSRSMSIGSPSFCHRGVSRVVQTLKEDADKRDRFTSFWNTIRPFEIDFHQLFIDTKHGRQREGEWMGSFGSIWKQNGHDGRERIPSGRWTVRIQVGSSKRKGGADVSEHAMLWWHELGWRGSHRLRTSQLSSWWEGVHTISRSNSLSHWVRWRGWVSVCWLQSKRKEKEEGAKRVYKEKKNAWPIKTPIAPFLLDEGGSWQKKKTSMLDGLRNGSVKDVGSIETGKGSFSFSECVQQHVTVGFKASMFRWKSGMERERERGSGCSLGSRGWVSCPTLSMALSLFLNKKKGKK